jgi:ketosteroid isomerase-like protein
MSASEIRKTNEAQVRQLIESWARAVRARDIDGILKNHATEMLLFDVPPPVQSKGIEAYRRIRVSTVVARRRTGGLKVLLRAIDRRVGDKVRWKRIDPARRPRLEGKWRFCPCLKKLK